MKPKTLERHELDGTALTRLAADPCEAAGFIGKSPANRQPTANHVPVTALLAHRARVEGPCQNQVQASGGSWRRQGVRFSYALGLQGEFCAASIVSALAPSPTGTLNLCFCGADVQEVEIRALEIISILVLAYASFACAEVHTVSDGTGGTGGTGGAGGMPLQCNLDDLEDDDIFDAESQTAFGTVHGTCQMVGTAIDCEGPDLLDEWVLPIEEDGTYRMELSWPGATSDLDLAVLEVTTCDILATGDNRQGTEESIDILLDRGAQVVLAVFTVDTNNAPEPYALSATLLDQ